MESFFQPVVDKIKQLLHDQLEQLRKKSNVSIQVRLFLLPEVIALLVQRADTILWCQTIILVGGFGDSPYLNNTLREWCRSQGRISLLCPEHPCVPNPQTNIYHSSLILCFFRQASVVKGAALRGLKGLVPEKRIARLHYGLSVMFPFREQIDPQESIFYYEWDGLKYCNTRMEWMITKVGDRVRGQERG